MRKRGQMDKNTMKLFNKALGVLCGLLPLCVLLTFLGTNAPDTWHSISATYFSNARFFMIGLLFTASVFFFCYSGYDWIDDLITDISAVCSLGIIIFPCSCILHDPTECLFGRYFTADISHVAHCVCAATLFTSFSIMILRFKKTSGRLTCKKTKRNVIYTFCSLFIILGMALQLVTSMAGIGWFTIINEAIMLWAFSFAWLVKGEMFKRFND